MQALSSDASGALKCTCGYAAVAVAIHQGRWSEARITGGVPLAIWCVFCKRPFESCQRYCFEIAAFLDEQLKPAQHSQEAS